MIGYHFTRHADRQLRNLPTDTQKRIIHKIRHYLSTGDPLRFSDSIEGETGKVYRYRIGDYRVIFDWQENSILILKVGHRREVYR